MNRIVRERYPVERLPEDLRRLLSPRQPVRLTLEQAETGEGASTAPSETMPLTQIIDSVRHRRGLSDDPVQRVRALRGEWDERQSFHDRIRARDDERE